jgi:ribosomal protein S18 acetylase RimI-like enzyme
MINNVMLDTEKIVIKRLPLRHIFTLHRLFREAVYASFTYFDQEIQSQTIRSHSPRRLFTALVNPRRLILTAWKQDTLIGYAIGSVPKDGAGQLYWLYVVPGVRGNNTGLALLSRFLKSERALGAVTVSLATYDHRKYYERQGFKFINTSIISGVSMDIMKFYLQ